MVFGHHVKSLAHSASAEYRYRIIDHSVFGSFDGMHLPGLFFDRHILVNHADSAFAGYGYGQRALCHGVHGGRDDGHVQGYAAGKLRCEAYLARQHI